MSVFFIPDSDKQTATSLYGSTEGYEAVYSREHLLTDRRFAESYRPKRLLLLFSLLGTGRGRRVALLDGFGVAHQ
jgi:hypothetical protein